MKEAFPTVTAVGFADDYRFVGPHQDALDAAALYRDEVTEAGHVFQATKGCIYSLTQATTDAAATHPFALEMAAPGHTQTDGTCASIRKARPAAKGIWR